MMWPGHFSESDEIEVWLWDPKPGCFGGNPRDNPDPDCFTRADNDETNLFCAGHAALADGTILATGGHTGGTGSNVGLADANLFDPRTETWAGADDGVAKMSVRRWYPTSTTLPDGRVLTVSGSNRRCSGGTRNGQDCDLDSDCAGGTCSDVQINEIPEIFDPATRSWTRLENAQLGMPFYPLMFVLPDGNVFYAGAEDDDAGANPTVTTLENYALDLESEAWRFVGMSNVPGGSGVMYEPGKVLKAGGGFEPATRGAQVIDLTAQGAAAWRSVGSLSSGRVRYNLTVLPDGTVLATGGTRSANLEYNFFCSGGLRAGRECTMPDFPPGEPGLSCPSSGDPSPPESGCPGGSCTGSGAQQWVAAADLFNPVSESWSKMASMQTPRMYHSTASLLPDGRVVSAGGGQGGGRIHDYTTMEIFSPPYLFKGERPVVSSAPSTIGYEQIVNVLTPDAADISSASLVRLAATTHGFDQNQRFVPLVFEDDGDALVISGARVGDVATPLIANVAPPGYYMLFLVNTAGVPSIGRYVRVGDAGGAEALAAPRKLRAKLRRKTRVKLKWRDASDNETGFEVQMRTGNKGRFRQIEILGPNDKRLLVPDLAAGTAYTFRVRALAGELKSDFSNEATVTTAGNTAGQLSAP